MNLHEPDVVIAHENVPAAGRLLFALLQRLRSGRLEIVTPAGHRHTFEGRKSGPHAILQLHDWGVCADILRSGDIGFAEAYLANRWQCDDLVALLMLAGRNYPALEEAIYGSRWAQLFYRIKHALHRNSKRGSRKNIEAHYDLGNEFYRLWLDDGMSYSAALFAGDPDRTLEAAQTAKYQRIVERLNLQAGDRILEIGCGWGGFAGHAALTRNAHVDGVTLSPNQLQWAQRRIREAGLDDRVSLHNRDYRDIDGEYDYIVSIEMFEAVGERYWQDYFRVLRQRLKRGGRAMIQTIVIADRLFERYRRGSDFIQQYVFPGGMLPSMRVFEREARRAGLAMVQTYAFGVDYAATLRHWRRRFAAHADEIAATFDYRFIRLWNFYLAYCEASFRTGHTDVMQIELMHA